MLFKDPLNDRWQDLANCIGIDPDLFFPERGGSTKEAKKVCSECVVREECAEYALLNGERYGIWGATSERERRRLRRKLGLRAQSTEMLDSDDSGVA